MPVFTACTAMSEATASIWATTKSAGTGVDAEHRLRVLGGQRRNGAGAVDAVRGKCLEIGLNAGAAPESLPAIVSAVTIR